MDAIYRAKSGDQIAAARALFVEYAESLDYEHCFKGFEDELAGLPSGYPRRIVRPRRRRLRAKGAHANSIENIIVTPKIRITY